jgi:hypothetical protein
MKPANKTKPPNDLNVSPTSQAPSTERLPNYPSPFKVQTWWGQSRQSLTLSLSLKRFKPSPNYSPQKSLDQFNPQYNVYTVPTYRTYLLTYLGKLLYYFRPMWTCVLYSISPTNPLTAGPRAQGFGRAKAKGSSKFQTKQPPTNYRYGVQQAR